MIDTQVTLGMVGSGFMARTYAQCIARHTSRVRLAAVAGGRRAPALAADYGVAYEPSVESLIARPDVDALVLATPESVHLQHTLLGAAAHKHLLVEKPLAPDVAQCTAMIDACRQAGVILMAVQTQRFRAVHQRAKQLILEGSIGRVWQIRNWSFGLAEDSVAITRERPWYADPEGGLFLSHTVHNLDLMRWVAGADATRVSASVQSFGDHPIPNLSAMAQVEFENAVVGQLWLNLEMPGVTFPLSKFRTQIVGEKGLLDFDGYTHLDMAVDGAWQRVYEQPAFDPMNTMDPVRLGSFSGQIQAFVDSILDGQTPAVTGEDGRAAVQLSLACLESSRRGRVVELPG